MKAFDEQIRSALEDYFQAIEKKDAPLRPHFEKLDGLLASAPRDLDPRLRHFLERKSYEKALHHLKDPEGTTD